MREKGDATEGTYDSVLAEVALEVALVDADGEGRDVEVVAGVVSTGRGVAVGHRSTSARNDDDQRPR